MCDLQQKDHHRLLLPGKVLKEAQRLRQVDGKFKTHL